jgi:hypothetical protein
LNRGFTFLQEASWVIICFDLKKCIQFIATIRDAIEILQGNHYCRMQYPVEQNRKDPRWCRDVQEQSATAGAGVSDV